MYLIDLCWSGYKFITNLPQTICLEILNSQIIKLIISAQLISNQLWFSVKFEFLKDILTAHFLNRISYNFKKLLCDFKCDLLIYL